MPATTTGRASTRRIAGTLVLVGAAVTVLGVVLPWVEVDRLFVRESVSGIDTNPGKLTLAAAIFAGLLTLVARTTSDPDGQRVLQALCVLPAVAIVFLATYNLQDASDIPTNRGAASVEVGPGLWLTLAGGLLVLSGGLVAARSVGSEPPVDGPAAPLWIPGSSSSAGER